jgi:stress response protein YsnF
MTDMQTGSQYNTSSSNMQMGGGTSGQGGMQTIVGVFDSMSEAQDARTALLQSGFEESAIQVRSHAETQAGVSSSAASTTHEDEGFMASVGSFFRNMFGGDDEHAGNYSEAVRRGSSVVVVSVADEERVSTARSVLADAGATDIDKQVQNWRQQGYSGFDPSARRLQSDEIAAERSRMQTPPSGAASTSMAGQEAVIPVVQEDIVVGKREVDLGRVRVFTRTEVRPVHEEVQLREERADIERRPVDRVATEADLHAFKGGTIEVQETAERAVVGKTARVVEEVVVGKESSVRTETIDDQVRNTVVEVERDTGERSAGYRSHYQSNFANQGGYEDFEPAYQYGSTLRDDTRYANRSWLDVESDAQRDWTSRNPNSSWDKAKDAVRHGWESMTGQR